MNTPNTTDCAPDAVSRVCAGCGQSFTPNREWSTFCSTPCRTGFANRMKARGGPLAPLVLAWNATRHAKPGTPEAEVCRYARSEITAIAGMFLEEDEEAGRASAVEYVKTLMASGTLYMDRARR